MKKSAKKSDPAELERISDTINERRSLWLLLLSLRLEREVTRRLTSYEKENTAATLRKRRAAIQTISPVVKILYTDLCGKLITSSELYLPSISTIPELNSAIYSKCTIPSSAQIRVRIETADGELIKLRDDLYISQILDYHPVAFHVSPLEIVVGNPTIRRHTVSEPILPTYMPTVSMTTPSLRETVSMSEYPKFKPQCTEENTLLNAPTMMSNVPLIEETMPRTESVGSDSNISLPSSETDMSVLSNDEQIPTPSTPRSRIFTLSLHANQ